MGQKVNPVGLRLGINRTWDSRWYADDDYSQLLHEDLEIRQFLFKRLNQAGIGRVVIERPAKKARITIHTARPGVVIGKKGADIERLRTDITKMTGSDVHLNIVEIRKPEIEAKLVAENIAQQLVRRVAFRRAMKRAVQSAIRLGAQGIRINCGGRLAEPRSRGPSGIAKGGCRCTRSGPMWTSGSPRHARPTAPVVSRSGCFKGEIMAHDPMAQDKRAMEQATPR